SARAILQKHGSQVAGNKSEKAVKLEENNRKKSSLEEEMSQLVCEIENYDRKDHERLELSEQLSVRAQDIDRRMESGNQYIPFYGIKYVLDTNQMVDLYNSRVRDYDVLNEWLNNNRGHFNALRAQLFGLRSQVETLKQENDQLQNEGMEICELLTIFNNLIVELQGFLVGIQEVRGDLLYVFCESVQQMQDLLDSAIVKITGFTRILQHKIEIYAPKLPEDIVTKIKNLIG
ncbi:MAG: hypothetical protein ACRCSI_10840, partial [Eubacterium aggregans]